MAVAFKLRATCRCSINHKKWRSNQKRPPETARMIMPSVCINDNDHSRLWGNLNTCVSAWDNVVLHVTIVNYDTPFPKMLSHQTPNNLHQYATTEKVLIRDDGQPQLRLPSCQITTVVVHHETNVLHKLLTRVHSVNTIKCL